MRASGWARAKTFGAVAIAAAVVASGATYAYAGHDGQRVDAARRSAVADGPAKVVGSTTKGACRVSYDTETSSLTPPDDSTSDNAAAGSVTMTKPCPGAVVAVLYAEVSATSSSVGSMHLDMRATCMGTGGFTSPCTVGQTVFGQPGHTFFADGVITAEGARTHSMQMVFPGLARGVWKVEALPGSNGATAFLGFRTFTVTAFQGG